SALWLLASGAGPGASRSHGPKRSRGSPLSPRRVPLPQDTIQGRAGGPQSGDRNHFLTWRGEVPQSVHHHTFANGLTLLTERMAHVRSAAFSFLVPAGCVY